MDAARVVGISAGSSHSVALLDCGTVTSWGRGEDGQLGHGDSGEVTSPKAVFALLNKAIAAVHCGAEYTVAVSHQQQRVYSWGWGDFGRLGHGDSTDVFIPRPITFFNGIAVKDVACGDTHTLVITQGGELYAFGRNQNGQLGLGHTQDMLSPQLVTAFQGQQVISVSAGAEHTVAATATGEVYGFGWGRYGNLGDGQQEDRLLPARAVGLEGVRAVKVNCGWRHTVVVSDQGKLYTYGWSKYGQLGHGDNQDRLVPTLVQALQAKQVVTVAGGWRHTMAADSEGTLYGWGWNKFGQLGLGDTEDRNTPTPVPQLHGTRLLASGWRHTMAVTESGEVYSWGRGVNGQLGHGTEEDRNVPTHLVCLSKGFMQRNAILATASPNGGYVAPADRYAVVPGGDDVDMTGAADYDDSGPLVPDMAGAGGGNQGAIKKARTDHAVPG